MKRYVRMFEEFREYDRDTQVQVQDAPEVELSDKTVDDVLSDDFFDDVEEEDATEEDGVINIAGWEVY